MSKKLTKDEHLFRKVNCRLDYSNPAAQISDLIKENKGIKRITVDMDTGVEYIQQVSLKELHDLGVKYDWEK